ncbi:MAG: DUF4352 domain-containing protein [Methanotrichaceae archaeon]|nr:DUF4352 domain-containing protein [Methanotrichaceae archaeon]
MHFNLLGMVVLFGILTFVCIPCNGAEIVINRLDNCKGEIKEEIDGKIPSSPANHFFIASIEIINYGYDSFYVDPMFFSVTRANKLYPSTHATSYRRQPLRSTLLRNGERVQGELAFEIPKSNLDSNNNIQYTGTESARIVYYCA